MTVNPFREPNDNALVELVRRCDMFDVLVDESLQNSDLGVELDVSKTTVHRILASFQEKGLVERTNEGYTLTPLGARIGGHVHTFRSNVSEIYTLEPLYEALTQAAVDIEAELFADATITLPVSGGTYKPVE